MVFLMGQLKIQVIRGMNLEVMDFNNSDPYVAITIGEGREQQRVITKTVYDSCNPYWHDEVKLGVFDLDTPIILTVYDKDMLKGDDFMGESQIDIIPYLERVKAGLEPDSPGFVVDQIDPAEDNCLHETSYIRWNKDGKLVQKMILRLNKVLKGEVEIEIEWEDIPGASGL